MLGLFLSRSAGLANTRTRLKKTDLPAGETTIVHELIADRAARPAAAEHRLITIEALPADLAIAGLDPQQHGLPLTGSFPNTHSAEV